MIAVELNNLEAVKYLLSKDLDVNTLVNGTNAVNLAYEKNFEEIILQLLSFNSMFPLNFNPSKVTNLRLKKFAEVTEQLHRFIVDADHDKIEELLESHSEIRFFYNYDNESAITTALSNKKLAVYEFLSIKNLQFGPFENTDEILDEMTANEKRNLRKIHLRNTKELSEKHVISLMSNSFVGHDNLDEQKKFKYVMRAYQTINRIRIVSLIMQIIAASKNFKIIFDFKRENVRHMDPTTRPDVNGLFYLSGRIYIAAKQLLDPTSEHIVFGVLAHEMCHYAMYLVYRNEANPFGKKDKKEAREFAAILDECRVNQECEEIIQMVYEYYDDDIQSQELIVRVPQILAAFAENKERIDQAKENFPSLFNYCEIQTIPDMERRLPEIKNEVEKEIRDMTKRRVKRQNKILKIFLVLLVILGVPFIAYLLKINNFSSWNELSEDQKNDIFKMSVNFQGESVEFSDVFKKKSSALHLMPVKDIRSLLKHETISIHEMIKQPSGASIRRFFYDRENRENLTFVELSEREDQVKIASGEPGSGRSFLFKHVTIDTKHQSKKSWVSYITLKSFFQSNNIQDCFDFENVENVIKFFALTLNLNDKNPFESEIFKEFFIDNRVILFVDELEEIGSKNRSITVNFILSLQKFSKNLVWITARPAISEQLETSFNTTYFKIKPFKEEDVDIFIKFCLKNESIFDLIKDNIAKFEVSKGQDVTNPFMLRMIIEDSISQYEKNQSSNFYTMFETFVEKKKASEEILKFHEFYAADVLLNSTFADIFNLKINQIDVKYLISDTSVLENQDIDKLGVLYIESEHYQFIHEAFAKFFLSRFFIINIFSKFDQNITSADQTEESLRLFVHVILNIPSIQEYVTDFIDSRSPIFINPVVENLMATKFKNIFKHIISDDFEFSEKMRAIKFLSSVFQKSPKALNAIWFMNDSENFYNWMLRETNFEKLKDVTEIAEEFFSNFDELKSGNHQNGNLLFQVWINRHDNDRVDFIVKASNSNFNETLINSIQNAQNFTEFHSSISFLSNEEKIEVFQRNPLAIFGDESLEDFSSHWMFISSHSSDAIKSILLAIDFKTYKTLLHLAVNLSDPTIAQVLISSIESNLQQADVHGLLSQSDKLFNETSFMTASRGESYENLVSLWDLIERNFDDKKKFLLMRNYKNFTALEIAASSKNPKVFEFVFEIFKTFSISELQEIVMINNHNDYETFLFDVIKHASNATCNLVAEKLEEILFPKYDKVYDLLSTRLEGDTIFSKYQNTSKLNLMPFNDTMTKIYKIKMINLGIKFNCLTKFNCIPDKESTN